MVTFKKLLRVTSYVKRFITNCRKTKKIEGVLTVEEIKQASFMWIRDSQLRKYQDILNTLENRSKESRNCLVRQLKLYMDESGLIRCKGRIQNAPIDDSARYPILLPTGDQVTNLVIKDAHERSLHSGINTTVTLLRQSYWIPKIRQNVKTLSRKCVVCRKVTGKAYQIPESPPLPKDRLTEAPPFTVTGVDFAGALRVRNKDGCESKVYVCLFTCANTRAVHLETVTDLSETQFMLAFRRFTSRKSLPKLMISDNATTYVASAGEVERLTSSQTLQETLSYHGTKWKFIPKRAPWYGEFWERRVGMTKNCIRKVLGRSLINLDVLNTVISEIEAILNDRPLTYVTTDPLDEDPLTPSHLLYGRKIKTLPYPSTVDVNENFTSDLTHDNVNKRYNVRTNLFSSFGVDGGGST